MNKYHVIVIKQDAVQKAKVLSNWIGIDFGQVIRDIACSDYNYEKETADMEKMFGDFNKCTGIMFQNCKVNRMIFGDRDIRVENCTKNCPKKIPNHELYLKIATKDLIIIIDADLGEVWRN